MRATKKAAVGTGIPSTATGTSLTDSLSTSSILPQDAAESQRIATLIVKNLCRLFCESTGLEAKVVSVKRRQDATTE